MIYDMEYNIEQTSSDAFGEFMDNLFKFSNVTSDGWMVVGLFTFMIALTTILITTFSSFDFRKTIFVSTIVSTSMFFISLCTLSLFANHQTIALIVLTLDLVVYFLLGKIIRLFKIGHCRPELANMLAIIYTTAFSTLFTMIAYTFIYR